MLSDRISIINSALLRTGNNQCQENDGSDEWIAGSEAYDAEMPELLYEHDWGFGSDIRTLVRTGASPHPMFTDAYARPADALHIENVMWSLDGTGYQGANTSIPYGILGSSILCNAPSTAPLCQFIKAPPQGTWPPGFVKALRARIMAVLYRGLNSDENNAMAMEKESILITANAKTRADQENPPRAFVNSRLRQARQMRRGDMTWPDRGRW